MLHYYDLDVGQEIACAPVLLDARWLDHYLDATGDESDPGADARLTYPPVALLALAMRDLFRSVTVPPGTVHTTQTLCAHGRAVPGDRLQPRWLVTRTARRTRAYLVHIDLTVQRGSEVLLTGRVGLVSPPREA